MNIASWRKRFFPFLLFIGLSAISLPVAQAADDEEIIKATKAYVEQVSPGMKAAAKVEKVDGDYARAVISAKDADSAWVFLKRTKAGWSVLTLGTGFSPEDYKSLGIPKSVQK